MTTRDFNLAKPLLGSIFTVALCRHDSEYYLECPGSGSSYCDTGCPFDREGSCSIVETDTFTSKQLAYLQIHHPEFLL